MKLVKNRIINIRESNFADKYTLALFVIYLLVLIWILLLKLGVHFSYMSARHFNLVPFGRAFFSNGQIDLSELVLNVIVFVPVGIYAGTLYKKWNFKTNLLFVFSISLIIESLQFVLKIGAFDITDIITNTSGGIIGLIIYAVIDKLFRNSFRAQVFVNIVATLATAFVIVMLILLKSNLLPIRYQ